MIRKAYPVLLTLTLFCVSAPAQNAAKAVEAYNSGLEFQNRGALQEALAAYDRAISINPRMLDAYNNRATVKLSAGDSTGALADLTKVIELTSDHPLSFYNRGSMYLEVQKYEEAIKDFTRAIEIFMGLTQSYDKKAHAMSHNNRGNALMAKNEFKAALADYERSLQIIPGSVEALTGRGSARQQLGEFAAAVADYSKALETAPKNALILMNRAGALEEIDKAAAIADYTSVIQLQPDNASAYAARGVALLETGRKPEAAADLRKALQMDPSLRADYQRFLQESLRK
jgi:tetratricopeptide (TPR) repeat protein